MTISRNSIITRASDLLASALDNELVLLSLTNDKYYGLNPMANKIWSLLEEPRSVDAICTALQADFEVDDATCERDVLAFIERLHHAKLVHTMETARP